MQIFYIRTKNGKPFSVTIEDDALGNDSCKDNYQDFRDACDDFHRRRRQPIAKGFGKMQFGKGFFKNES